MTERDAGSDAAGIDGTAERTAGGYRIRAEKWFVTNGRQADYFIVVVNVVDGDRRLPTLFLVDRDTPGITVLEDPPFSHNYPDGHPTIAFDCEVPADAVLGGAGGGRPGRRAAERVVHRGAHPHRGALRGRDAAAARRDDRLGDRRASSSASRSWTSRASASRSSTRRRTASPRA